MKKLEKLKEINTKINKIIGELETYIFIKGEKNIDNKFLLNYNQKVNKTK